MSRTLYGKILQGYRTLTGSYFSDAAGKLSNVSEGDLRDLVDGGCIDRDIATEAVLAGIAIVSGDGSKVLTGAGTFVTPAVAPVAISFRTVSGTTDTLLAADNGNGVRYTSASSVTVTYPAGLGAGFNVLLVQRGTGSFTVANDGTTVITNRQSQSSSAGQGAECSLVADTADNAIFAGDTA